MISSSQIFNLYLIFFSAGMSMGEPEFIRHCEPPDFEQTMIIARKDFPSVQLLLIIINRKDNSDYGKKKRFQYNNILIIFLILETVKRVGDLDLRQIPTMTGFQQS